MPGMKDEVIAFLNRQLLRHTRKQTQLRLKILYPFRPKLAVKANLEQSRIDHYQEKIELWESLRET